MSEPENAPLPLIRHALLRDQVYNLLRTQVLDGTLPPGSRLVEDELAERLGASRTPVREAMHRLMVEGLVVASKGRGLEVADVGPQELKEAIEIRLLLEKYAIGFAARLAAPEEIEQLRETCRLEKEYLREHPEKHLSELFQLNVFGVREEHTRISIASLASVAHEVQVQDVDVRAAGDRIVAIFDMRSQTATEAHSICTAWGPSVLSHNSADWLVTSPTAMP